MGERVTAEQARMQLPINVVKHLLHFFGDTNLGQDGGHFVTRLLELTSAADAENRDRLRSLWPEYVTGFEVVQQRHWGLDWLRTCAKRDLDREWLDVPSMNERLTRTVRRAGGVDDALMGIDR